MPSVGPSSATNRKRGVFTGAGGAPPPSTRPRTGPAPSASPALSGGGCRGGAIVGGGCGGFPGVPAAFPAPGLPLPLPPPPFPGQAPGFVLPPVATPRRARGRIVNYDQSKGYGFISSPDVAQTDVYFQRKELPHQAKDDTPAQLKNKNVEFQLAVMPDGKPRALHIFIVDDGNRRRERDQKQKDEGPAPPLDEDAISDMTRFLEDHGGAMDFMAFSREFKGVRKSQLRDVFTLTQGQDESGKPAGRLQITLHGVDPLPPEELEGDDQAGDGKGHTPLGRLEGTVQNYDSQKGYGFIKSEQVPEGDCYFKKTSLPNDARSMSRNSLVGSRVEFDGSLTPDGKPRAANISIISGPDGGAADGTGGEKREPDPLEPERIQEMKEFLSKKGGYMDYGKFANQFTGVKKTQLLDLPDDFTLIQQGEKVGGRWMITLFGVEPPDEEVEEISFENGKDLHEKRDHAPAVIAPSEGFWLIGCIKKWDPKKQFGFIVADGADDVFVHRNDLPVALHHNRNLLGTEVVFELGRREDDGKPRVITVRPLIQPDGRGGWQLRRAPP